VWISGTKGASKSRTVHLPAFLPNWSGFGVGTMRPQIGAVVSRLLDPAVSLWEATEEESALLWRHGFTPLNFLLWHRLRELFSDRAMRGMSFGSTTREVRDLPLFPTRNRARAGRDGQPNVQADPGWKKSTRIVEGAGTYMAQSNWAKLTNPLLDHVSEQLDEWPEHRTNSSQRNGWTHHGLRHWAMSSRLQAGVPLPVIATEMGHSDANFTLERYGHVLDGGTSPAGFES
jgi:integrase